jgi:hypothetical protein
MCHYIQTPIGLKLGGDWYGCGREIICYTEMKNVCHGFSNDSA